MILPSPLAISAVGTAIGLAAVGVGLVLKQIRLAIELGALSVLVFAIAGAAAGYKAEGRAEVQEKFDAYIAEQKKIVADTTAVWTKAVSDAEKQAKEALDQMKGYTDGLNERVAHLTKREVILSADLSNLLQYAGSHTAPENPGTQPGSQDTPAPVSVGPQTYDETELGTFIANARKAYDSCHLAWNACVTQYEGVRNSTKGN